MTHKMNGNKVYSDYIKAFDDQLSYGQKLNCFNLRKTEKSCDSWEACGKFYSVFLTTFIFILLVQ